MLLRWTTIPCGRCHSAYRHIGPIVCKYTGLYLCGILISVNLPSSTKASIPEGCETNYQALQHTEQLPCVIIVKNHWLTRLAASEIIIRQKPIMTIMMLNENSMYMEIAVGQVIITRLPTGLKIRTSCFNTWWDTINIDCTFQMVRKRCYVQWGVDLPEIKFTAENDGFLNLYSLSF